MQCFYMTLIECSFCWFLFQHLFLVSTAHVSYSQPGVPEPLGAESRFLRSRNAIVAGESLHVLGCIFFKRTEFCESL